MHGRNEVFNVETLTKFLNNVQETLSVEEELVAEHMKEYLKYCGKEPNVNLEFKETDVSAT